MRIDNEQAQYKNQTERNFAIENKKLLWDYISNTNVFTNSNHTDYLDFRLFISQELQKPEITQETLTTIFQKPTENALNKAIKLIENNLREIKYSRFHDQETYLKNFIKIDFKELLSNTVFSGVHYKAFAKNLGMLTDNSDIAKIIVEKAAKDMFHTSEKRRYNPTLFLNIYTKEEINETTENNDEDLEEITENLEKTSIEAGEEY